jgi:hypothetical protein
MTLGVSHMGASLEFTAVVEAEPIKFTTISKNLRLELSYYRKNRVD